MNRNPWFVFADNGQVPIISPEDTLRLHGDGGGDHGFDAGHWSGGICGRGPAIINKLTFNKNIYLLIHLEKW